MKILIFNWRDIRNPLGGGSEIYFHEIAKRWVMEGNEVTFICSGFKNCKKEEIIDGIKFLRIGGEFSQYILAPLKYFTLKEKPDIVIDVENGLPFFTPLFCFRKKILHIHHIHKEVWFREKPFYIAILGKFLESKIMPAFYHDVPITTISKSSYEEIINEKISKFKPEIINPGINFVEYKKFEKNKKPAILFLNRIKKYKGIKIFLDAAKKILEKNKETEFWIVGSGELLEEMKNYCKKEKNIIFFGKVSEEKKYELMQKAWVFVNPSFKEGWGIVNIEANYFGVPVIGSNVGGIKDSVVEGKTGLLFKYGDCNELADKINQLIKNNKLRKKMSSEGIRWSKKFSWNNTAREFLKVLNREIKKIN